MTAYIGSIRVDSTEDTGKTKRRSNIVKNNVTRSDVAINSSRLNVNPPLPIAVLL